MDTSKTPSEMTSKELSTALYHIAVNNDMSRTYTLGHVKDILLEAHRRLSESMTVTTSGLVRVEDAGASEVRLFSSEGLEYKTVVTEFDQESGTVEQTVTFHDDLPSIDDLRKMNREVHSTDISAENRVRRDWTFNPEDMEDYVGDPDEIN